MTMELQDLPPLHNPKGGSPKSPYRGIPVNQFQQQKNGFLRSNLFIFFMGQVVTVLGCIIFFAIAWGKLSQQFVESIHWRDATQKTIERMDSDGTNYARYEIKTIGIHVENLDGQLKVQQEQVIKIPVIQEKIERLESSSRKP